jgi:hypothetical protein
MPMTIRDNCEAEHSRIIAEISKQIESKGIIVRSLTNYGEPFGSWWFAFRVSGKVYRLIFDGRDKFLSLQIGSDSSEYRQSISNDPIVDERIRFDRYQHLIKWKYLEDFQYKGNIFPSDDFIKVASSLIDKLGDS